MSTALLEAPGGSWTELSDDGPGDHPARLRLKVTDTSGNNQLGCIWGLRSRYYDSSATAALFYEAEALTPVNGAAVTGLSGASGGNVVTIKSLPTASWVSMLSTTISATTGNWTHQGSYRVWARCYSATGTPQFQLAWGVRSLSVPVTNTAVTLPGSGAFYLLDLGEVRIDGPPVGTAQWFGVVQTYASISGQSASVDCLYLQPLDDGAGQLTYVSEPPASLVTTGMQRATAATNDASSGTVAWVNPANSETGYYPSVYADVTLNGQTSEYLKDTAYGFSIPSSATIKGLMVTVAWGIGVFGGTTRTFQAHLVKAGTVQAGAPSYVSGYMLSPTTFGGQSDLWGAAWTPSDINNSGFGAAFQVTDSGGTGFPTDYWVYYVQFTVYYTLSSGFTVVQDAVVYGSETTELRHDGMWRQGPSSGPYGVVSSVVGDLARMPPSGLEGRPCQIFVKPTRGDFNTLPDAGLDGFTVEPIYRPSWIFRP